MIQYQVGLYNLLLVQNYLKSRWRQASNKTTAADVETFIESAIPRIGIIMLASDASTQTCEIPVASVPITIAELSV